MRRSGAGFLLSFTVGLLMAGEGFAQVGDLPAPPPSAVAVDVFEVASGDLVSPNTLVAPGDGSGRMFVVDQPGEIRVIDGGSLLATPFLDLGPETVPLGLIDERGLLGLAFHPDYADAGSAGFGRFYTYHSVPLDGAADFTVPMTGSPDHQSVVTEWTASDPASDVFAGARRELLRIDQPQANHNGGQLAFGPAGHLWIGLGDGGSADDQGDGHTAGVGNGQDPSNVLGALLRIDPLGNDAANGSYGIPTGNPFTTDAGIPDEIFAYGARNPFRFSFDSDPGTGDTTLFLTDVGQANIEEINQVDALGAAGANFGWNLKEGTFRFLPGDPGVPGTISDDLSGLPAGLVDPFAQLDHDETDAIIGGFLYRGSAIPGLVGKYVFGAYSNLGAATQGRLFTMDPVTGAIEVLALPGLPFLQGIGLDAAGEIHLLTNDSLFASPALGAQGRVLRLIVPEPSAALLLAGAGLLAAVGRGVVRRRG